MSEHIASELHRLYRDYYSGRLALVDYRYQRGMLLDSLAGDGLGQDGMATMPREKIAELDIVAPQVEEPVAKPRGFRWQYVVAACIPLLAAVVYFATQQMGEPVPFEPLVDTPASVDAEIGSEPEAEKLPVLKDVVIVPDVGQSLAEEFVARDDWREPSLKEFQETWGRFPASDRIVAKGALWFAPLVAGLRYQIGEAVEFSADPENDARLSSLYQFALNLGVPELAPSGWRPRKKNPVTRPVVDVVEDAPVVSEAVADVEVDEAPVKPAPAETESTCRASQLETRRRSCHDLLDDGSDGPAMRVIAAGSLADGSVIDAPFAISASEISRRDFESYCQQAGVTCPEDPWPEENMPVVNVSWNDAVAYCDWLTEHTGYRYRLPSNTEWEYVARAGSESAYPFGDEISPAMSRYSGLAEYDRPLPVTDTTTRRNKFGLWHVVGNVREWVSPDVSAEDDFQTVRGGSFADSEDGLRLTIREKLSASSRDAKTGFRVLREL